MSTLDRKPWRSILCAMSIASVLIVPVRSENIDPGEDDSQYAWAENVGWLSFSCSNTATCGTVDYGVKTGWICDPLPATPSGSPDLEVDKSGSEALLSWDLVSNATGSDMVYGGLTCLRSTGGDFTPCTTGCADDNRTTTSLLFVGTPPPGDGFWFLVRGQNCGGNGTYDTGGAGQVGARDAEIAALGNDCP